MSFVMNELHKSQGWLSLNSLIVIVLEKKVCAFRLDYVQSFQFMLQLSQLVMTRGAGPQLLGTLGVFDTEPQLGSTIVVPGVSLSMTLDMLRMLNGSHECYLVRYRSSCTGPNKILCSCLYVMMKLMIPNTGTSIMGSNITMVRMVFNVSVFMLQLYDCDCESATK